MSPTPTTTPTANAMSLLVTLAKPNPDETDVFQGYVQESTALAIEAGGEVSSRIGVRHLHGDAPAVVFGLAVFPSAQAIAEMFDGEAYRSLIPARDASIECVNAYTVASPMLTELPALDDDAVFLVTVAAPNPDALEDLAAYQQAAGPLAAKHGGAPVAQLPIAAQPVGETPAAFIALAAFPSVDAVDAFFEDPEYRAIVEVRDRALSSLNLYVGR